MAEKRIETVEMRAGDVKTGFGNPRKITKKKKDELRNSIETFGDFGSFIIDENDNIIGGNMRLSVIKEMDPDTIILCKRLIGYSETELRAINIKDNTHSGDWDMDLLADWTADLTVDLGLEKATKKEMEERSIPEMELIHYEKYDYVMIVCKNELDYNRFYPCSTLLEINLYTKGKAVTVAENVTGNYANTAASDLQDFFNYLDSEEIVDKLAAHGMDISLEPPVRDLTNLQNDSKYRYRAMAEATVSFSQEANGRYGIGGMDAPNASGGGSAEMADATSGVIEEVEISEETYEGGKA